jgi:hypothetical protein
METETANFARSIFLGLTARPFAVASRALPMKKSILAGKLVEKFGNTSRAPTYNNYQLGAFCWMKTIHSDDSHRDFETPYHPPKRTASSDYLL